MPLIGVRVFALGDVMTGKGRSAVVGDPDQLVTGNRA